MKSVELFAGAGGLGMGLSLAGFIPVAVVEWDKWASDTIRENKERRFPLVSNWPLVHDDVREWIKRFSPSQLDGELDVVAGGPPCQPFSMGGKHRANRDTRDMFPAAVDVVRKLRPRAFIIENVKGLTRSAFANYFTYIRYQFEFPELQRRPDESWLDHFHRLQRERSSGKLHRNGGLTYNVNHELVNAADFGVPQKRERVFIVGFRNDLSVEWDFPKVTHSFHALMYDQWVTGDYWERHGISKRARPKMPSVLVEQVEKMRGLRLAPTTRPWRTVRDAIADLPDPKETTSGIFANHKFQPGARPYPGHTGSPLDLPAKTLKAGDHGVPGGENMLVTPNGDVRYFTVRESARLQTFPDGYILHGSWTEAMRQLGNAVPVSLAHFVAATVAEKLLEAEERKLRATLRQSKHSESSEAL
jgi:DNA (cytosine-5)-methyltransferase 1